MSKKFVRSSNFELLRIFSMMLIIFHHLVLHGGVKPIIDFTLPNFVYSLFYSGGKLGVALFIMITGYFMINKKDVGIKKLIRLELQVLFYSISFFLLIYLFGQANISDYNVMRTFFPIGMNSYWFFTSYFILCLFIPYINKVIKLLKADEFKKILIIGFIFLILFPSVFILGYFVSDGIYLLYYYLLGAYIRLYCDNKQYKKVYLLFGYLLSHVLIVIFTIVLAHKSLYNNILGSHVYCFTDLDSIFVFGGAVCLFLFFKNLKIKNSKIINWFGSVSFGVYLFHEYVLMKKILWVKIFRVSFYYEEKYFLIYGIVISIIIYLVAGSIEYIRKIIIDDRLFPLVWNKFINLKIVKRVKNKIFC